ncbi:MAG TPA: 2-hydroxyacyl-CoA dehydratase [Firmicutes bacterium]|nr:2-hydroxyacyl-CoA dehydratase [Bacillota bacterium]
MNGGTSVLNDKPQCVWLCSYTPVELIHAAGFEPIRLIPDRAGGPRADSLLPRRFCTYVRACLERRPVNQPAMVSAICCDSLRRLADVAPIVLPISLPRTPDGQSTPEQVTYLALELKRTWGRLHRLLGKDEPSQKESASLIRASIEKYRRVRQKILQIQRLAYSGEVSFSSAFSVATQVLAHPPEESSPPAEFQGPAPSRGKSQIGLLLAGANLLDGGLIALVEEAGGRILDVDCCNWNRFNLFDPAQTDETSPPESSSLDEVLYWLAESYLKRHPCPRQTTAIHRARLLAERARKVGVRGVIFFVPKFCDVGLYEGPVFKRYLDSLSIPCLVVEIDYGYGDSGQARTRVEAFLEMLEAKAGCAIACS